MSDRSGIDSLDDLAALAPPPPPLGGDLERELAAFAPVATRRPHRQLAVLAGASLLYAAMWIYVLTVRGDLGELPAMWVAFAAVAWLAGFLVPSYLALVPHHGSLSPRWRAAALATVVTGIGFVTFGLAIHPMGRTSWDYSERFLDGHICLEFGLITALVPVLIGTLCLRRALPVGSRWIAAGLGAGAGCLGGLMLHLHCPIADGLHIGLIHGSVVIVAAALAAVIIPRATEVR